MRRLLVSRWAARAGAGLALAALLALGASALYRRGVGRAWHAAEEALERGDHPRAAELFLAVAEEYPRDSRAAEALFQVASIDLVFLHREQEAVLLLRELARGERGAGWSRRAQRMLGELFEQRREGCRQAIVEYQRFISLQPEGEGNDGAQLAVARCYFALGDFEQARAEYEVLLERYPESALRARAREGLAASCQVTGRNEAAARQYRQVLAETRDPQLAAEAGFGLASALEESGDLPGALRELERIRTSHPNPRLVSQRIERVRGRLAQQGGRGTGAYEGRS